MLGSERLWPWPAGQGLAVTLSGAPLTRRIDPFVGGGMWQPKADGASLLTGRREPSLAPPGMMPGLPLGTVAGQGQRLSWAGEVQSAGGQYEMELRGDAAVQLTLDGRVILARCTPGPPGMSLRATVDLAPGWHTVQLDYQLNSGISGLEWLWTRPDGVRELVPPTALRYRPAAGGGVAWPQIPAELTCAP
jgi:hypothetical protein